MLYITIMVTATVRVGRVCSAHIHTSPRWRGLLQLEFGGDDDRFLGASKWLLLLLFNKCVRKCHYYFQIIKEEKANKNYPTGTEEKFPLEGIYRHF
jgi:hypothetical protein